MKDCTDKENRVCNTILEANYNCRCNICDKYSSCEKCPFNNFEKECTEHIKKPKLTKFIKQTF